MELRLAHILHLASIYKAVIRKCRDASSQVIKRLSYHIVLTAEWNLSRPGAVDQTLPLRRASQNTPGLQQKWMINILSI